MRKIHFSGPAGSILRNDHVSHFPFLDKRYEEGIQLSYSNYTDNLLNALDLFICLRSTIVKLARRKTSKIKTSDAERNALATDWGWV